MADFEELWRELGPKILGNPESDEPRLEFAASLDDERVRHRREGKPSPRAELIYLQLRLAEMPTDHPEWFRVATRVRSLLIDHQQDWVPRKLMSAPGLLDVTFYRGFVAKVTVAAWYLMEMAPILFRIAPIQHLDIVDLGGEEHLPEIVERLTELEIVSQVHSLGLDSQGITHAESLDLGVWSGLRWLSLRYNHLDLENVRLLLKSAPESLLSVDFYGNAGDPAPRLSFDQGVVISSEMPIFEEESLSDRRATRSSIAGHEVHPDRFALSFERAPKQFDFQ